MPNPEQIRSKLCSLSPIEDFHWSRARGDSLWEGTEKGGHFHFFNRVGSQLKSVDNPAEFDFVPFSGSEASISGSEISRANIEKDFISVLGKPLKRVEKHSKTFLEWKTF
jgi:hypothetical protein